MMHRSGKQIMLTHPIYIEDIRNKILESITSSMDDSSVYLRRGYVDFSIGVSKFIELDIHVTPIDGELRGLGSYIFFKNESDAVAFKLRWI